jgi:hypothetical protein
VHIFPVRSLLEELALMLPTSARFYDNFSRRVDLVARSKGFCAVLQCERNHAGALNVADQCRRRVVCRTNVEHRLYASRLVPVDAIRSQSGRPKAIMEAGWSF